MYVLTSRDNKEEEVVVRCRCRRMFECSLIDWCFIKWQHQQRQQPHRSLLSWRSSNHFKWRFPSLPLWRSSSIDITYRDGTITTPTQGRIGNTRCEDWREIQGYHHRRQRHHLPQAQRIIQSSMSIWSILFKSGFASSYESSPSSSSTHLHIWRHMCGRTFH